MKKVFTLSATFLVLLIIFSSASAKSVSSRFLFLSPSYTTLMLVDDVAKIQTGPLHKNINYVKCDIQGKAVSFIEKFGNPALGYSFRFKAIRPGEAVVLEKISRFGKKKENLEIKKFRIKVYAIDAIPEVLLSSIVEHPQKYAGSFVLINGMSRGWGKPVKAPEVWGTMVTRSNWIIEDGSGAAYVTGIQKVEKGEAVRIICRVSVRSNGTWALFGHRILPGTNRGKALKALVQSNNAFAFDLAMRLFKKEGNAFFSPFSISDALAMSYVGARGETKKQIAKVLRFSLPREELHPAFSSLIDSLHVKLMDKACKLHIANALWNQKGYGFLPSFTRLIDRYYGGGFYRVDFAGNTEGAKKRINSWIEKKTEEKIKNLIARGDIGPFTRLVLTNAIYFKGKWASVFKKSDTRPMPFHLSPTKTVQVPMMHQKGSFPYFKGDKVQMIELPYAGDALSMLILLPNQDASIENIKNLLTEAKLRDYLSHLHTREIMVYLPRFKVKSKYYLGNILSAMGMPDAFSDRADFSGMTGNKELKISKVIHQAYVEVNEEGTEATATTAMVMRLKAVMFNQPIFKADHPFVFMILHRKTGNILFMGRVMNPNQQ